MLYNIKLNYSISFLSILGDFLSTIQSSETSQSCQFIDLSASGFANNILTLLASFIE